MPQHSVVIGEIYPSFYKIGCKFTLTEKHPNALYHISDARQVRHVCDYFADLILNEDKGKNLFPVTNVKENILIEEGWILAVPPNGKKYD